MSEYGQWTDTAPFPVTLQIDPSSTADRPEVARGTHRGLARVYQKLEQPTPVYQMATHRACMVEHAAAMEHSSYVGGFDEGTCPPLTGVFTALGLNGLSCGAVFTWAPGGLTAATFEASLYEGWISLDLLTWLSGAYTSETWGQLPGVNPTLPAGASGFQWETSQAAVSGSVAFTPRAPQSTSLELPLTVEWRGGHMPWNRSSETPLLKLPKAQVLGLPVRSVQVPPAAGAGWTEPQPPVGQEQWRYVLWPANHADGDPGHFPDDRSKISAADGLGLTVQFQIARPRHRFIYPDGALPQPRSLRQRQRDDLRQRQTQSRQRTIRQRGYY